MFQEKPDFSTSDLYGRILIHQFMIEQNRYCQSWGHFTQEKYYVWVWKVFLKSWIPIKSRYEFWQIFNKNFLFFLKLTFLKPYSAPECFSFRV